MSYISYDIMCDSVSPGGCSSGYSSSSGQCPAFLHHRATGNKQHTLARSTSRSCRLHLELEYFQEDSTPISIPRSPCSDSERELELTIEAAARCALTQMFNRVARKRGLVSPTPDEDAALERFMGKCREAASEEGPGITCCRSSTDELLFDLELA
eukprot:TRINITY_DN20934_c0_g1_i1.p1 TRINITY_DN20934_c0_g1~~TRINITY_DN20934_c0_g1_i1.p1  ORF type:complete len:155 (-),score=21.92 TRINITY_DN20934_c0_g1_i1:643-1107(-)